MKKDLICLRPPKKAWVKKFHCPPKEESDQFIIKSKLEIQETHKLTQIPGIPIGEIRKLKFHPFSWL